jgi:hypothetical protein
MPGGQRQRPLEGLTAASQVAHRQLEIGVTRQQIGLLGQGPPRGEQLSGGLKFSLLRQAVGPQQEPGWGTSLLAWESLERLEGLGIPTPLKMLTGGGQCLGERWIGPRDRRLSLGSCG